MTVEEKMFSIFQGKAAITALVPIERIKTGGDWQNLARPYIIHNRVALEAIHTHTEGLMALRKWRFYQVMVAATSYGLAATIVNVIVKELDGYHDADVNRIAVINITPDKYDTDKKIQEIAIDFEVTEGLEA